MNESKRSYLSSKEYLDLVNRVNNWRYSNTTVTNTSIREYLEIPPDSILIESKYEGKIGEINVSMSKLIFERPIRWDIKDTVTFTGYIVLVSYKDEKLNNPEKKNTIKLQDIYRKIKSKYKILQKKADFHEGIEKSRKILSGKQ